MPSDPQARGPYMNEDGDWWVAVEDVPSFVAARNTVLDCLDYEVPDDGTLRYKGKRVTTVCDAHPAHEVGPECDATCSRRVLAYHFEEHRLW